ncbi:MAG TPA: T9SS type A sorting domain-containing protein [Parafilimonas sp.]|nr:T9SS type A sorting domain-containing protein [Parafilimonas sp.]
MEKKATLVLFSIFLIFSQAKIFAQPGSLDLTFGDGGKVITKSPNHEMATGQSIVLQPDGKILMAGSSTDNNMNDPSSDFMLVRYLADGQLDSSFGINGIIITDFRNTNDQCFAAVLQPNGKIILAGFSFSGITGNDFALVRYKKNGTLDSSFGVGGKVVSEIGVGASGDYIRSMVLQPDGKILVAGTSINSGVNSYIAVARYNIDGTLDATFGDWGKVFTDWGSNYSERGFAIALDSIDNKFYVGGYTGAVVENYDLAIAKYNADGNLDNSFGVEGKITRDINNNRNECHSLVVQPDRKLLVGGYSNNYSTTSTSSFILRYKTDGTEDNSFGVNGIVTGTGADVYLSLSMQKDDKIIASGYSSSRFLIARFYNDGNRDSSFGTDGAVRTFIGGSSYAQSVAIQQDTKIIACGFGFGLSDTLYMAVARYNAMYILPVILTSFTAAKQKTSVLLNWQTTSELNNKYFSIERGNAENNFSVIGYVNSKGDSHSLQDYSFIDSQPLNGENYYRLKQVDADGHFAYSKIVSESFRVANNYKLYPNPVKNVLHIDNLHGSAVISIISQNGTILNKKIVTEGTYEFNVKNLSMGVYYVRIDEEEKVITMKFVKE